MNPKVSAILIFIIVLATFITGAFAYPHVGSFGIAFAVPIALLILFGLWAILPAIDPATKGFKGFRHIYDLVWILISAMLAYVYALILGHALGWQVDAVKALMPGMAILFFVVGMVLPRVRRNWFFGIRTPWTLSSDDDWTRTQRFGGPLLMIASVFILIGTFTPDAWSIGFLIGPILIAAIASIVYSYVIFRREETGGK